jgi:hypothetical protein
MRHSEYLQHLRTYFLASIDDGQFWNCLQAYTKEFFILSHLNLDPSIELLNPLYSPTQRVPYRDPTCMLRSLILMTCLRNTSITKWVRTTRSQPLLAVFMGFDPKDTPGIGTYYDFMKRLIDGPYQKPCEHRVRKSDYFSRPHLRNLQNEKAHRKEEPEIYHSQSERVAAELLASDQKPRPNGLSKILEDLLIRLAVVPTVQQGFLHNLHDLVVSGDGSILQTAASPNGRPTCDCRSQGIYRCDHDRSYTTPTAKWCYDAHRDCLLFGDRYYHLVVHQNGHDFPLLTIMPGGDESDFTLSLKAFDRFLKAARENGIDMRVGVFCGDGHHDSYAHYLYFEKKNVSPVIPLSERSKKAFPHLLDDRGIQLDTDGTPLCPEGLRMRHHQYNENKRIHVYTCPVKRITHRNGRSPYVKHLDECPKGVDCAPASSLGPLVYIKSQTDPRLYPPIPRDSKRFRQIMNQRSSTERCNYLNDAYGLDRACRNVAYGIIRLTLANIVEHAVVRYREALKGSSENGLLDLILREKSYIYREQYLDTG